MITDFFMRLSQALDAVLKLSPEACSALSDLLSPEFMDHCLADTGVVTVRKHHLPMGMLIRVIRHDIVQPVIHK